MSGLNTGVSQYTYLIRFWGQQGILGLCIPETACEAAALAALRRTSACLGWVFPEVRVLLRGIPVLFRIILKLGVYKGDSHSCGFEGNGLAGNLDLFL